MFVLNDDLSIYVTRGDIVFFNVYALDNGQIYSFKPGDMVRFKVYGKKDAGRVVLQKNFPVTEARGYVAIYLNEDDTKIGEVISKPVDYWYEVELNPDTEPQTIIGYDEDGAKIFKLFPEGGDFEEEEYEPSEEDFPVVDEELDLTSPRPVANQTIARNIASLEYGIEKLGIDLESLESEVDKLGDDIESHQTDAADVNYDNTQSGISAQKVQEAIDLLATLLTVGKLEVDFSVEKASPRMQLINPDNSRIGEVHFSNAGNLILSSKQDNDNLVGIWVKPETEDAKDYLDLGTYVGGVFTRYPIFGTYNKPTGKYEGTGSATTRIVTTGGIGSTLKISTNKGMAIVTGAGAICKKYSSKDVYGLTAAECNYENGVLTLTTDDDVVNAVKEYFYEVL